MHEIVILLVDFNGTNFVPTSDGRKELKVLGNKVKKRTAGKRIYEGWNFNSGNYLFTTYTK